MKKEDKLINFSEESEEDAFTARNGPNQNINVTRKMNTMTDPPKKSQIEELEEILEDNPQDKPNDQEEDKVRHMATVIKYQQKSK